MKLPTSVRRIALDVNIFIYHLRGHPKFGNIATSLLDECKRRKTVVSTLVFAEIFVSILEQKDVTLEKQYREFLEKFPNLSIVPANKNICFSAAQLRAAYRLKTPDAIHLATAIDSDCAVFITNDDNLKKVQEIKVLTLADLT